MDTAAQLSYGATGQGVRGDYSTMAPDWTCDQAYGAYTPTEHERYRRLYAARSAHIRDQACEDFLQALARLDADQALPRFDDISRRLRRATGWELAAVPGLIPEAAFFTLLAQRRFPVTTWLREEHEFNYIVEPDIFHDFFGHVPLLFNPVFADYMQAYGAGGMKAHRLAQQDPARYGGALECLARLYWYTVEFGLIKTDSGLRIYGAGILSSDSEPVYALHDPRPQRIAFQRDRVMQSRYHIDRFQDTYFVIESIEQLFEATAPDFTPVYERLQGAEPYAENIVLPDERVYPPEPR